MELLLILLLSTTNEALVDGHLTTPAKVFIAPVLAKDGGLFF